METVKTEQADLHGNSEDLIPRKIRRLDEQIQHHRALLDSISNEGPILSDEFMSGNDVIELVPGRVAAIEIENFMCHCRLRIDFDLQNANCFFIGGSNGSGKSALFAALNIGLGGQACDNDRGKQLNNYIRNGCKSAKIRIHLTNAGYGRIEDLPEVFVVERVLGPSSYIAIRSGTEEKAANVYTRNAKDVRRIIEQLGIQLQNPIFWMSQDRCRSFLAEARESRLFDIFFKASELDVTEQHYAELIRRSTSIARGLENLIARRENYQKNEEKLNFFLQTQKHINAAREELLKYEWYSHWVFAKNSFQKIQTVKTNLSDAEVNRKKVGQEILVLQEKIRSLSTKLEGEIFVEHKSRSDQIRKEIKYAREVHEQHWKQFKILQAKKREFEAGIKMCKAQIALGTKQLQELDIGETLTEEQKNQQELIISERRLKQLEESISDIEADRVVCEKRLQKINDHLANLKKQCGECSMEINSSEQKLKGLRKYKERAEITLENDTAKYGKYTVNLIKLIEDNVSRFHKKPVGPIGRHIFLKDKKWALAIENALGDALATYVVDNKNDFNILEQVTRSHFPNERFEIVTTRFLPRFNTVKPDLNLLTVERSLEIDNDVAFNFLVDNCGIENILLMEDDGAASQLLDGNCPKNISRCYTLSGAKVQGRNESHGFYRFFPSTNSYIRYMKTVEIEDISAMNLKIRDLDANVHTLKERYALLKKETQIAEEKLRAAQTEKFQLRDSVQEKNQALNQLQLKISTLEANVGSFTDPSEAAKELIARNTEKLEQLESEYELVLEEFENANVENENNKKRLDELESIQRDIQNNAAPIAAQKAELDELRQQHVKSISDLEKFIDVLKEDISRFENELIASSSNHDENIKRAKTAVASLILPEDETIPPDFTKVPDHKTLSAKVQELNRFIKRHKDQVPDVQKLQDYIKENQDALKKSQEEVEKLSEVYKVYETAVEHRKELYPILRDLIMRRVQISFKALLERRNIVGKMSVDFEGKKLQISVWSKSGKTELRPLKALSGGERSYVTTCFVMALWNIMDSPFRCLDEFDVFMDAANRKTIMDLIVAFTTNRWAHSQFFLFTPQGTAELDQSEKIRLIKMPKLIDNQPIGPLNVPAEDGDQ